MSMTKVPFAQLSRPRRSIKAPIYDRPGVKKSPLTLVRRRVLLIMLARPLAKIVGIYVAGDRFRRVDDDEDLGDEGGGPRA